MTATQARIAPIIIRTYGNTVMARALAKDLAEKIDARAWDERGREHMVMMVCWNWMTGGSTAESAAREIEAALR